MIFIEKMKNFKIYRTKTFLPTVKGDKKKSSAVLLMSPNYESSKKLMNSDMFVNSGRFESYYLEKDVSYYINGKVVEEVEESTIIDNQIELQSCLESSRANLDDSEFGVSSKRKFPLDTEAHVRSAVKFFNYVEPEDEEELAEKLNKAIDKYDIIIQVSDKNRFSKYYNPKKSNNESVIGKYHGILSELDLYYYSWKIGNFPENETRRKIYQLMVSNGYMNSNQTPMDIPSIEEYFKERGLLNSCNESVDILNEAVQRKNDKGETIPKICPKCGGKIGLFFKGEPIWQCQDCQKFFGVLPFKENTELKDKVLSETMIKYLPEDAINLGDKVLFFNEATMNDNQLKRLLYRTRIKYRKDVMILLDKVKNDNPWIKYTFPDLKKYIKRNVFVDLYYYSSIFFENNGWVLKKGFNLYLDFMTRLLNHPNIKNNGYTKKTIFIPVLDWDFTHDGMIWNFRKSINPISCIYQLMFEERLSDLKKAFGNIDIMFVGKNTMFKINFSQLEQNDIKKLSAKFKIFCIKMCKGEDFQEEDIDSSADFKEDPEVISAKIVDKIELSKGIDLTKHVAKSTIKQVAKNKSLSDPDNVKVRKFSLTSLDKTMLTPQGIKNANKLIKKADEDLEDELDYDITNIEDIEKSKDIEKLADVIAKISSDSTDEEDALELMNNDEIKRILVSLGDDDEVDISASRSIRMSNLDTAAMDKLVNGRSVKDILSAEKPLPETTTINVSSPNKEEWSNLSYMNLDKKYDIDKDIVSIFKMFSKCSRPMVIRDIQVKDNSTSEDRLMLYDVSLEDYKGRRFRIKLDIPIMEDNRFLLRGYGKSIQTQFFNMPIIKTDLDQCQLISNYRKIFIERFGDNKGRSLPAVSKLLKAIDKYSGNKLKISYGNNTKVCSKYHLPMDYIDIAGNISKIESTDWIIYFNQDEIRSLYTIDDTLGTPFVYNKKLKAVEYFRLDNPESTFINSLCSILFTACPELDDLFATVTRSSGSAYSRAYIMKSDIPLVLVCAYHIGLTSTMNRAGIKYEIVDKLSKEIKLNVNKDWIEFDDGYVVYDVNYESSLIMSGLKIGTCLTEMFSISEMDSKNMYLEFLDNYGGRIKADGLENFYDLFVDPMTKEALEYYHLPTDYIDMLLYGSAMLADNKYTKHTDTSSRRLRRYQLISVYAYQVLASAYGEYMNLDRHSNNATFAVKQSAVIDTFLTDNISSDDSCINALRDIETTNAITTKGPSGMNSDRAYTLDKRSYDESMINVLGMSTGFAGNVGITRQATINANVTSDGYVKSSKNKNMDDASSLTATEALIPFGSTRDDPMRTAMSFIQTSKHMVRTEDSDPLLVTSGADEVIPYLTTDRFAFKAKEDGIVLECTDDHILVEYTESKKKDYINLKETIEKNSDGGYFVPLKLDAADGIKDKIKFKKNQILAYDKYSFSNKLGESNNIAYNIGKLAKIAILNTDEGFEDAGIISDSMAKKLATRVNIKFQCVVNKDSRVFKIAKVGDHIEASDDLIIWENAFDDEDSEAIMTSLTNGSEFSDIGKRKLECEVTGTLKAIKMFRTVEIEELSPSLRKIVTEYEKPLIEEANFLESNGLSKAKVDAHYKVNPTGKMKRAQEAVLIEFYVEYLDTVGVGDKIVYNSANKAVEKGIFPKGKEPYTDFRPNEKIDAFVADTSISKRIVTSTYVYGSLQKLMIELDRSVKDIMGIPYDDSTV